MRSQEQSIQGTQRKRDYEAYASVLNGFDASVVREIALGHRICGNATVYDPDARNHAALLVFNLAGPSKEIFL